MERLYKQSSAIADEEQTFEGCDKRGYTFINLYWKLEFFRRFLNKFLLHRFFDRLREKDDAVGYWWRVYWNFSCGYSVLDSFLYDFETPAFFKWLIRRLKRFVCF